MCLELHRTVDEKKNECPQEGSHCVQVLDSDFFVLVSVQMSGMLLVCLGAFRYYFKGRSSIFFIDSLTGVIVLVLAIHWKCVYFNLMLKVWFEKAINV